MLRPYQPAIDAPTGEASLLLPAQKDVPALPPA